MDAPGLRRQRRAEPGAADALGARHEVLDPDPRVSDFRSWNRRGGRLHWRERFCWASSGRHPASCARLTSRWPLPRRANAEMGVEPDEEPNHEFLSRNPADAAALHREPDKLQQSFRRLAFGQGRQTHRPPGPLEPHRPASVTYGHGRSSRAGRVLDLPQPC